MLGMRWWVDSGVVLLGMALLLGAPREAPGETASGEMVRFDWYFRESLEAIDDWEAVLETLEKKGLATSEVPAFPVPVDGQAVCWPCPLPPALLPPADRSKAVHLRLTGERVEVERNGRDKPQKREPVAVGTAVRGCFHPGGGGKDQWYHAYQRRFDRLLSFRPVPAPLAVVLDGPLDLHRGSNEIELALRSAVDRTLVVTWRWDFHRPSQSRAGAAQTVRIAPGAVEVVRLPVELSEPGGGLLRLKLEVEGHGYEIPLLTHVENVAAVLQSIERILADTPDPQASRALAGLKDRADALGGDAWRSLFEEASFLRDDLLLRQIAFDTLLFSKRKPFFSEQPFMDAHHLFNRPGGGIFRLSPVRPGGQVRAVVDSLGEGVYRDICLHWDAQRLLFAFGNGSDQWDGSQSYHLYEVHADGSGLRRLTSGPKNDCEGFYLADGRIGFTSDRSEHFVMCGGDRHAPTLFSMQPDGSDIRQLSFNVFNDFNPTLLPDGRILYCRWEYNERSVTSLHNPFTMNPDGTMVAPYYGNATIRPNVVMFPRPVPGSRQVMALFTAHHGQTHGAIGLLDVRRGIDGPGPLTVLTPRIPITGERAEDSRRGWYSDPWPLSETTYLCSYTPTVLPWLETSWALYVGDRHGNLALIYRDAEISCAEPIPLVPRPHPHAVPSVLPPGMEVDAIDAEATLVLADVSIGLGGVSPGTARYLRILEDVPRKGVPRGGVVLTSGTQIFTIKRILGTVPIEPDGSAHWVVPANRNVYFEVLDANQQEIQRMRSVVCLKPGERRACIGCHEARNTAPPARPVAALHREPSRPQPPPWGTQIISFLRDVQPVLNARCIACHTHDRATNRVILTDDLTDQFTVGYQELLPYIKAANANRWDHPDDVFAQPLYTYGSKVSPLMRLLDAGHHDVRLSEDERLRLVNWIDANAVYYDRYESDSYGPKRNLFVGEVRQELESVHARRCITCHSSGDGGQDTWWMSLNRHDVALSRVLAAPLAQSVGGWQRCDELVFATQEDPDYRKLLSALARLRDALADRPREDLASLQGSAVQRQKVVLPDPPPPRPPVPEETAGGWSYLSNLNWELGTAGWTANGDRLPRRDRDVTEKPLRLGGRRYRKGLGTHAPSEIVYRLDGQYSRFSATVGGAEQGGTVIFQVFGDDRLLFESGLLPGLGEVKAVDVPVAGVTRLRLVVTDAGDNYYSDMANWAEAKLQKSIPVGATGH